MIFSVMSAMLFSVINPVSQTQKGNNAKRQYDLSQIRSSLDTFYNDYNKYPATLEFGQNFSVSSAVYMRNVPQDPSCKPSSNCENYVYITDPQNPQWFVLLARLEGEINSITNCPFICNLEGVDLSSYNYCVSGGNVSSPLCRPIAFTPIPTIPLPQETVTHAPTPTPTPGGTPTNTPTITPTTPPNTPTPTIAPLCAGDRYYYCGCSATSQPICKFMDSLSPPDNLIYYCEFGCYDNGVYQCQNFSC